jgi:hypothetical protein
VYSIAGRKAIPLGAVKASSMEAAIAVASVEFGVPAGRILVLQAGDARAPGRPRSIGRAMRGRCRPLGMRG